jgi:hypothetical protein
VRHAGLPPAVALPCVPASTLEEQPQASSLLEVPAVDAPLRSDAVLTALEQLYAAYKVRAPRARRRRRYPLWRSPPPPATPRWSSRSPLQPCAHIHSKADTGQHPHSQVEHWAVLEELRALHGEFTSGGKSAVTDAAAGAAPGGADTPAAESFRELLHALGLVQPRREPDAAAMQQQV